jgi:hypothetical protein
MGRPRKNRTDTQRASVSSDDDSASQDKLDVILEKLASLDSIVTKLAKGGGHVGYHPGGKQTAPRNSHSPEHQDL